MAEQKIFAEGFYFERRENAPDFVIGRVSVKVNKAVKFLNAHANEKGYVNMNILRSKDGGAYMELDTWTPKKQENGQWTPREEPKKWTPKPQTQAQIDEMKNKVQIEYPEEDLGDSPF